MQNYYKIITYLSFLLRKKNLLLIKFGSIIKKKKKKGVIFVLTSAVIVCGDFIVCATKEVLYKSTDITLGCSAITKLFIKSRQQEVKGGTLYCT